MQLNSASLTGLPRFLKDGDEMNISCKSQVIQYVQDAHEPCCSRAFRGVDKELEVIANVIVITISVRFVVLMVSWLR
jgi:hypothetical protein